MELCAVFESHNLDLKIQIIESKRVKYDMLSDSNHRRVTVAVLISENRLLRQQVLLETQKDILVDKKVNSSRRLNSYKYIHEPNSRATTSMK